MLSRGHFAASSWLTADIASLTILCTSNSNDTRRLLDEANKRIRLANLQQLNQKKKKDCETDNCEEPLRVNVKYVNAAATWAELNKCAHCSSFVVFKWLPLGSIWADCHSEVNEVYLKKQFSHAMPLQPLSSSSPFILVAHSQMALQPQSPEGVRTVKLSSPNPYSVLSQPFVGAHSFFLLLFFCFKIWRFSEVIWPCSFITAVWSETFFLFCWT